MVSVHSDLFRTDSVGNIPAVSSDPPSLLEQVRGMNFNIGQNESINEGIGKENMKKNVQSEKKKRVSRPRVMFDPIFETPMKPKTPKPYTPKRKTSKAVKTKRRVHQEKPLITKTYSRRKKLNESSVLQDDCETTSVATKRVLDFDLNCQLDESIAEDVVAQTLASDEKRPVQDMNPRWFYSVCRRKRTPSRVAKARLRRLLPAGKVSMNDTAFKCIKALTRSFVIATTRKRKRRQKHVKQHDENVTFIDQDGSHEININGLDQSTSLENKKVPKGRKKQKTSENTKEKHTSGLDQSPRQENNKVPKGKKKKKTSENTIEYHIPGITGNALLEEMAVSIIDKLQNLSVTSNALVPYHCKKIKFKVNGSKVLVPYKNKVKVDVDVDPETLRVWNLLKGGEDIPDPVKEADEAKKKWWEEQRRDLTLKVAWFVSHSRLVLGDLRFSPWKGSVVDSVVGVYLTQNVSDSLSSNAFMSVVARYPAKVPSENSNVDKESENVSNHEDRHLELMNEGCCKSFENDTTKPESIAKDSAKTATDAFTETNANTAHANDHSSQTKTKKKGNNIENINWDTLRTTYSTPNYGNARCPRTLDSVDWEAIRKGDVKEFADTIKERGQHNILAQKIKDFLDRIVNDHGSIDLEWLRSVPPDKTKEYLLSIRGLGLKSVECLRLLTLRHHAFPVDTNVLRIAIRLGWVPLQQLSDPVLFHLIDKDPDVDKVQAYLWTRLFHLNTEQLYELHYLLITFGKVLCTKRKPRCNACPLREDCKYFASVRASSRPALDGTEQKSNKEASKENGNTEASKEKGNTEASKENGNPTDISRPPSSLLSADNQASAAVHETRNCEPIIEEPPSPSPERESMIDSDIEDLFLEDPNEMLCIDLTSRLLNEFRDNEMSKAMVTLSPHATTKPIPQKIYARLKTEHNVYELPDFHPLLRGLEKREVDDPTPYLLAIWPQDESTHACHLDDNNTASSSCACNAEESLTVPGTLLIPCRTAMKGSFPLNATYFQVNEVFADDESSLNPINVPRSFIWNLKRRIVYCGSSIRSLGSEYSIEQLARLPRGAICIRGFNRRTRFPRKLAGRFHERVKSQKAALANKTKKSD